MTLRPWRRLGDAVARARLRAIKAAPGTIRPLTESEIGALARRISYYHGRPSYMLPASRIAREMIVRNDLHTALEMGPYLRPIIVGADVLDRVARPELMAEAKVFVHDATQTPWSFRDKQYDLFVALQVFEHLGDRQSEAFREVCRIARHAIISLPIDWDTGDPSNVHHKISHERALGWFAPVVPTRVEVTMRKDRKRVIYTFENLEPV